MENQNILDIYTYKSILYNKNTARFRTQSLQVSTLDSCSAFVINIKPAFNTEDTKSVHMQYMQQSENKKGKLYKYRIFLVQKTNPEKSETVFHDSISF